MAEHGEEQKPLLNVRVVVIPVDDSEYSEAAFDWYCKNLYSTQKNEKDKVVIVHCTEMHPPFLPHAMATEQWHLEIEKHQQKIKELEQKYIDKLKDLKELQGKKIIIETSPVGEHIIKVAKKEKASMIVMASRGRGTITRTLLGSVSSYVVHHAHIPVLIVPAKR